MSVSTEDVISQPGNVASIEDLVDSADIRLAVNLNICPECHKDAGRHLYDHLFTVHGYSKYDVEKAKKQKRRWKLFSTASPSYICNVCSHPYKTKRALLQHRKEKEHFSDDGETLQLILCPLCDDQVQDQEELMNHVSHEHAAFLKANFGLEKPIFEHQQPGMNFGHVLCPECGKSFKREHIGEHSIFVHKYTNRERQVLLLHLGIELTTPVPELSFKCEHCSKNFERKQELSAHLVNQHPDKDPSTPSSGDLFPCGFDGCNSRFSCNEDLATHCARIHSKESGQQFKLINTSFESKKDFLNWKFDVEKKSGASFRFRCTGRFQTAEYACAKTFISSSEQESSPKRAKVPEQFCTAFIKCRPRSDGTVEAIGCMDHIGHLESPESLLSEEQKDEVCRLLSNGSSALEVVNLLKQKYDSDPKISHITSSDIASLREPPSDEQESTTADQTYSCVECGEGPMSLQNLVIHSQEVHDGSTEDVKDIEKMKNPDLYYSCEPCRFVCFTETVMDSHMQTYHPDGSENGSLKAKSPLPESIFCPTCQLMFRTKYQLAVHCVTFHASFSSNAFIVQTSFSSWAQFQPWLEKMEKNTRSVLVKSAMQGCGTKLIHSYNCQFDKAVLTRASQKSGSSQFKNCPAFVKVIENEDGVLDCVGFFDHLGHDEKSLIEGIDSTAKGKENAESKEPCFLCGNDVPPEVDGRIANCIKWFRCNITECRSLAHDWCIKLLGKKCMQCEKGLLVVGEEEPPSQND